jgi:hypothetical protein
MNTSSLARRLEEYEADAASLKLARAPVMRRVMPQGPQISPAESLRPVRRARAARTIQIRDQGLRPFRVS